jgi:glycosyltransferase involved in cell wall biosynthesis
MDQRIKLMLIIPHLGGGGAERVVAQLARHLDPSHFEIHLALLTPDGPGAEPLLPRITVHCFHAARVRHAWLRLLRLIRAERPAVILSGMAHLNFLLLLLKPLLPRRTRLLVRQNTTASAAATRRLARLAYRHLYPRADSIICQSQGMADDLIQHFGVSSEKLTVLANPIEINPIEINPVQTRPQATTTPELLFVGRLSPEKGLDLLLNALPTIKAAYPQIHLTILGTGPASLLQHAQQLGLEENVTFAGYADPPSYYPAATLFVLPSRYEGMPNALLEAAAAGLPIVATPCSTGVTGLLRDAPGVWLTPEITAEALAQTILTAIASLIEIPQRRFHHAFLAPFELRTAIASYARHIITIVAPRRLALLIPTIDQIGGAERQVLLLARELASRGWQVTIVALSGAGRSAAIQLTAAGIAFLSLEMRKAWIDPRGWLRYRAWVRRHRPSIIHAHLPHATWFARWSRLVAAAPVVIDTIHTSHVAGQARRFAYRISNWLANQVTCVSESVAEAALSAGMVGPEKLVVIPNGVPLPAPQSPRQANRTFHPFQWLAVGRLASVKDYPTLLRAFAALRGQPRLTIVGIGSEEAHLRALAGHLKIGPRVHFAGFHANVQPLLQTADAFVLSSLWEGLPVSVLEASAAGLPVVATGGAGTIEAMLPGKTGLLVAISDHDALARAMTRIMAISPEERLQMGANGRQFVEEKYSLSKVADQWEQLYTQLLT